MQSDDASEQECPEVLEQEEAEALGQGAEVDPSEGEPLDPFLRLQGQVADLAQHMATLKLRGDRHAEGLVNVMRRLQRLEGDRGPVSPGSEIELLTVKEAARRLSLSVHTVRRHIHEGRITAIRPGKSAMRIPSSEIPRLLTPVGRGDG